MWRSRRYPLGVFSRSRLDWQFEIAMTIELEQAGTLALFPVVSLYNDAADGRRLALMAVLAWATSTPALIWATLTFGKGGTLVGAGVPLVGASAVQWGAGYRSQVIAQPTVALSAKFLADGKTWLSNPAAPLAVIPAGWRYELFTGLPPNGEVERPTTLIATFVWLPV